MDPKTQEMIEEEYEEFEIETLEDDGAPPIPEDCDEE